MLPGKMSIINLLLAVVLLLHVLATALCYLRFEGALLANESVLLSEVILLLLVLLFLLVDVLLIELVPPRLVLLRGLLTYFTRQFIDLRVELIPIFRIVLSLSRLIEPVC
jgi:hypothetical protein